MMIRWFSADAGYAVCCLVHSPPEVSGGFNISVEIRKSRDTKNTGSIKERRIAAAIHAWIFPSAQVDPPRPQAFPSHTLQPDPPSIALSKNLYKIIFRIYPVPPITP
jgi:hypothetical protein